MLTTEERNKIHEAMLGVQGDVRGAAALLGLEVQQLKDKLRADPNLKARWVEPVKVPTPIDTINREPPKVTAAALDLVDDEISKDDVAISNAVAQQDDRFRRLDWEGLGVTDPKTLNLMRAFEKFAGGQILQTIDATHGGMLHTFATVSARLEFINEQIMKIEAKAEKGDLTNDESMRLMFLHKTFKDLADQKIKINDTAARAAYTRLQIIDRARKLQGAGNKIRKKAGWRRAAPVPGPAKGNNGPQ